MFDDAPDTDRSLRAVQNAALERALAESPPPSEYVALAGALEAARSTDEDGDDSRGPRSGVSPSVGAVAESVPAGDALDLAAILCCLLAVRGLDADRDRRPSFAPSAADQSPQLTGAILAHERFDLPLERAAGLAGRRPDDFASELARLDADARRSAVDRSVRSEDD